MELIKDMIYLYEDKNATKFMENTDDLIERDKYGEEEFEYVVEVGETEDLVVFAYLSGFTYDKKEDKNNEGRYFQVETLVLSKKMGPMHNQLFLLVDNEGLDSYARFDGMPYWTLDELVSISGHKVRDAYGSSFSVRWSDFK